MFRNGDLFLFLAAGIASLLLATLRAILLLDLILRLAIVALRTLLLLATLLPTLLLMVAHSGFSSGDDGFVAAQT